MNIRQAAWLILLAAAPARSQPFGQNQVIKRDFDWKVRSTEHFDIHYYEGSKPLVPEAAEILERAYLRESRMLDVETEPSVWASAGEKKRVRWERKPFFLYASQNDFEQSTIAELGDGTGGVTEPFKNRFMVYNNGERQWLDEVIPHELTHVFQFHVLINGWWKTGKILKTIVYPLWFIEGMPDYVTEDAEPAIEEALVRDAATSGGLVPLYKLEHFGHLKPHQITLAYHEGAAAMRFIADQFGGRKIADMLHLFDTRLEINQVLLETLGLDIFDFDKKFREYEVTRDRRVARVNGLKEPSYFGGQLTYTRDAIPQFNASPAVSPDGKTMYYLSTSAGHPPQLRRLDLRTGRDSRLPGIGYVPIENIPMGNFANLSRVLSVSADGRWLAFAGTKNHEDAIYLYDLRAGRLQRISLPGFQSVAQPGLSPDGRRIVFSGMKGSYTDIYLYDRAAGTVRQLTDDLNDEQMPVFMPDGGSIVYSQETVDPMGPGDHDRRLQRLDLNSGSVVQLESSGGQARDPLPSNDGKTVLFILDDGKFSEVCELDVASGGVRRLTRTIGGSFTPAYAGDEVVFSSLRRGNVHIYKGPRSGFLAEGLPSASRSLPRAMKFMLPGMGSVGASTATLAMSPERPYQFTYSTDLFIPALFYSSVGGFFWTSYWQGSDLLGRHTQTALVNFHDSKDFDYAAAYSYKRYRPEFQTALTGSGRSQFIDANTGDSMDDAYHAQSVSMSYPFDRYHRADVGIQSATERIRDTTVGFTDDHEARMAQVSLVRDTLRGRYLVPESGDRLALSYLQTAETLGGNRRFNLATAEAQRFVRLGSLDALALRLYGGQTVGRDHPQLILGGLGGVRGYARSDVENAGSRIAGATAEWRFPILRDLNYYMWYFFPDFYFKAIFGTLFTDAGLAWNSPGEATRERWGNVRNSVGIGLRIYTFILQEYPLVVAMDWAQRTTQNGGIFYVYLGQSF